MFLSISYIFLEIFKRNSSRLAIDGNTVLELRTMQNQLKYDALLEALHTKVIIKKPRIA